MKFAKNIASKIRSRLRSLVTVAAIFIFNTMSALAQSTTFSSTDLKTGISNSLAVIMMFGFVLGIAAVIYGGFAIRRGDVDQGKMSIIGGAIIAAAPAAVFAFYKIFGLDSNSAVGDARINRHDTGDKCFLDVTLRNPGKVVALMAHLQLHRERSGDRVLPVFYTDNYISLVPGETKTVTVESALADLKGEKPLVVLDGWNIDVVPAASSSAAVALNTEAQVSHWPVTGLPIYYGLPLKEVHISCGGSGDGIFKADMSYDGGAVVMSRDTVDTSGPMAGPAAIYQSERWGDMSYRFSMAHLPAGYSYTVRLHFAETKFASAGQRVFNVDINGQKVLNDFDIVEAAGGKDKAVVKEFTGILPDSSNNILIRFRRGRADEAKISAIEIIRHANPNAATASAGRDEKELQAASN